MLEIEAAVAVAVRAGYVWLEVLLRRDLLVLEPSVSRRSELAQTLQRVRAPLHDGIPHLGHGLDAARLSHES